jgi:uncharacterized protein (TIGR01244 family)
MLAPASVAALSWTSMLLAQQAAPQAPAIDLPHARTPMDGVLTGGPPTPQQLEQAAALGYRTVVDLRSADEPGVAAEAEQVRKLGLTYVHIPVAGAADLTDENARALALVLDDPAARPALVHCASGNRVGALIAVKAYRLDGRPAAEALRLGMEAGLRKLEIAVRQKLGL